MTRFAWTLLLAALLATSLGLEAQQAAPDLILSNGKIITVDDTFSIAQAVAVRGDRIVAVGSNAAKAKGPGQWVFTLGGWSPDQFTDNKKPFTRDELDQVLPNNPVLLQFTRVETYLNSKAIDAIGLEKRTEPWVNRDAKGRATGIVDYGGGMGANTVRNAAGFLKALPKEIFETSQMTMLKDFAKAGLTASGGSCDFEDIYKGWAREGRLSMRFFCFRTPQGRTVEARFAAIPKLRYHDGDEWIDHANWGEGLSGGGGGDVFAMAPPAPVAQSAWDEWGRFARAAATNHIPIQIHTVTEQAVEGELREVEKVAKDIDIRPLARTPSR